MEFYNKRKSELILIVTLALVFVISFFTRPLFPVQRYPLFADAPTTYETYHASLPTGEQIPLISLQLQNNYDGDPTYDVGRHPATIYTWGKILSIEQLQNHFSNLNKKKQIPAEFCLIRTIWGKRSDQHFGVIKTSLFWWSAEHLSENSNSAPLVCRGTVI
ncbi:hypothetical protein ACLVWU_07760 [Bdellovibrio sp. HCB290]|uniref:hypothetical protein n=1 Tax=Bdellovibrio sp. HCB290 TaxID=3394356 RepID=UPI0039B3ED98